MKKYISLFTGAGGFDIGLEAAGFSPVACIEIDEDARKTISLNRPDWNLLDSGDIFEVDAKLLRKKLKLKKKELDLIAGGPPCQPFSKATYWINGDSKRLDDARSNTIAAYFNFVNEFLPKSFILENVKGLTFKGKDEGLQKIIKLVDCINLNNNVKYKINVIHTNAAEYGIPQIRERVFIVASIDGKDFVKPPVTHADNKFASELRLKPYATCWDAIGNLKHQDRTNLKVTGKWAELLKSIPEGQNYLWHTNRGGGKPIFGWRTRYWTFLLKLAKDRPSWTISANPGPANGPFHWENRLLGIDELCRIQTFSKDYKIYGDYRSARKQIGNAVPSALGEVFGLAIRKQLLNEERIKYKLSLIPCAKLQTPKPSKVYPVAADYQTYYGEHKPHPGTGLGPQGERRLFTV